MQASSVTLTFTAFTTVYDDDGLLIFDASNDAPLAAFTGQLPVPMSVTFATSSLRVALRVQPGNRQLGFNATYDSTAACAPLGCTSGGTCASGQCVCPPGFAGADCSLTLQPMVVPDSFGTSVNVSGSTAPGDVSFFEITLPTDTTGNATLVLDMTWQGDDEDKPPAPMLLLLKAPFTPSAPLVYISNDDGTCSDISAGGCHWAAPPPDASATSSDSGGNSTFVTLQQGPTAAFALHGALVTSATHGFGLHAMRLPALPTPTAFTYRDTASWASRAPHHMLAVPLPFPVDPSMTWRVGVANTLPTVMPSFLAADATGTWGQGPGYLGAAGGMHFTLRVAVVTNGTGADGALPPAITNAACPGQCSGRGTCLNGACVCASTGARTAASDTSDPPGTMNTSSEASDVSSDDAQVAAWAGPDCSSAVTFLTPNGTAVSLDVTSNGQLTYLYLPLDASLFVNAALVVELAFDGAPSADLTLLLSRASSGPPGLAPPVCRVWRHGAGPWLEDDCGSGASQADFVADFIATASSRVAGDSYRTVYVPPETHVLPDAQPLGGGGNNSASSTFETGYYVAIYAPVGSWVATTSSVPVQLRAAFHYVAALDVSNPACPFDCSGNAAACSPPPDWTSRGSTADTSVALAGTCVCVGSSGGGAFGQPSSTDTTPSPVAHAGLYCQYDAPLLAVNSSYTGAVAYGGWAYLTVDLPGPGAVTVSLQTAPDTSTEAASDAVLPSPVLLFKQGSPPKATAVVYSDAVEFAPVNCIGPATNQSGASTDTAPPSSSDAQAGAPADAFSAPVGAPAPATAPSATLTGTQIAATSCGPLGTPGNAILALRGVLPRAAQVVQLSFDALALFARDAAAARGACVALITASDGILDAVCPAVRGGGLTSAEEASGGMWGASDPLLPDTAFPPTSPPGPASPQLVWARTLSGVVTLQGELIGRGGAYLEFFQMDPASEAASIAGITAGTSVPVAAQWQGVLRVGFTRPIDTGFDATDMRAVLCAGVDCAEDTPTFGGFQLTRPARVFIGMYRPQLAPGAEAAARAATVQALRADPVTGVRAAPPPPPPLLGYTLSLTYIPADNSSTYPVAVPCFSDCGPNGQCLASKAPQCTCNAGFYGPTCAIQPSPLFLALPAASGGGGDNQTAEAPAAAPAAAPGNVAEASGIVNPGRLTYFSIRMTDGSSGAAATTTGLPGSLLVTLSYPGGTGAHGHVFARAGKLPVACHVTDGGTGAFNPGAVRCRDAYDAVDMLVPPLASTPAPVAAPASAPSSAPAPPPQRTVQRILILTPSGGGTSRAGMLSRAGAGMRLGYGRGGIVLAVGNPASSVAPLNFSLLAMAVPGELCPGGDGTCGGHGSCDTTRGVCACDAGWAGPACDSPVYAVTPTPRNGMPGGGADTASATSETEGAAGNWLLFDAPILPGRAAFITFSINCTDQALNLTIVPALVSPDGESDTSDSSSSTTSDVASSSDDALTGGDSSMRPAYLLALRRGGLPSVGNHIYDMVAQPRPADGALTLLLPAARPGVYTAELYVSPRAPASVAGFKLAAAVTPSGVPNPWNGCTQPDGSIAVSLTPTDPATSTLDAAAAVTLNSSSAGVPTGGDVAQLALGPGACANTVCDIATAVATAGGRLNGTAVLALAAPSAPNAAAYFYQAGDPRKHVVAGGGSLGTSNLSSASSDGNLPIGSQAPQGAVLYVTLGGNGAATDLEACTPLINSDAVRAGGICVAVRGGCTFTTKVAACQAAGAAVAVIINNDVSSADVGAINWLIDGPSAANISIPAVALSFTAGQQLLGFMLDPTAVPGSVSEAGSSPTWNSPYTRSVFVNISVATCQPTAMCLACAPGLASPLDGCMSAACPGMDARYTRNCSGHGLCTLNPPPGGGFGPAQGTCACADGWGGLACGASTVPPWFISRPADIVSVAPGQTVRLLLRAVDATFGSITYSLPVGPPGAKVNPTTGLFLFDTAPLVGSNTSGPINTSMAVQITATGGNGLSASASFTVLVTDAPPGDVAPAPMQADVSSFAPSPEPVPDPPIAPTPAPAPAPAGDTQPKSAGMTSSEYGGGAMTPSGGSRRKHKGLDGGAVAGIVIAVLAATGLAGLAALTYSKHRHSWVGPVGRMRQARMERHQELVDFN